MCFHIDLVDPVVHLYSVKWAGTIFPRISFPIWPWLELVTGEIYVSGNWWMVEKQLQLFCYILRWSGTRCCYRSRKLSPVFWFTCEGGVTHGLQQLWLLSRLWIPRQLYVQLRVEGQELTLQVICIFKIERRMWCSGCHFELWVILTGSSLSILFLRFWVCQFQAQHQKQKMQPYVDCLATSHVAWCLIPTVVLFLLSNSNQSRIWYQMWGVLVTYCCVTKHPNVYWLKTIIIIILLTLLAVGWALGKHPVGWVWFGSCL